MQRTVPVLLLSGLLWSPLNVHPDGHSGIRFDPSPVEVPSVRYGQCRSKKLTITNESETSVPSPELSLNTYDAFDFQKNRCPEELGPGKSCKIWINFCPPHYDTTYTASLLISGKDTGVVAAG